MKKNYIISIFFIILVASLIYKILDDNKKVNAFFSFHENISEIIIINNDLDKFINAPITYKNFDSIKINIINMKKNFDSIKKSTIFENLRDEKIKKDFFSLEETFEEKIEIVERLKSTNAILNNSFRNIVKIVPSLKDSDYLYLYTNVLLINLNPEISYLSLLDNIKNLSPKDQIEELFLLHAKVLLKEFKKLKELKEQIKALSFKNKVEKFSEEYSNYTISLIDEVKVTILIMIFLLTLLIGVFLFYSYIVLKDKIELNRFKNALENSDNFIIVTDKNKKIKYINSNMLRVMGYKKSDVIGKDPSFFRSGFVSKDIYKEMNKTIYSGKKWVGEFINKTKDNKIIYEKASITPILNEKGEIEEFLGIKLDITHEREMLNSLKEKDHRLTQQAKLVVMNEILNSIAHQWRQPLSVISTATSGLRLNKEYETLSDEVFDELTKSIMSSSSYLSTTIDNFKSFFKTGNELTLFDLDGSFDKAYKLVEFKIANNKINYVFKSDKKYFIKGIENDLIQVFVNLISNSIEALGNKKEDKNYIFIEVFEKNNKIIIKIKDNANGISEKNMSKLFQPYFTTKHESQGTGMGVYMSNEIITKQFNGKMIINNLEYIFDKKDFKGVEVTIILPIDSDIQDGKKSEKKSD